MRQMLCGILFFGAQIGLVTRVATAQRPSLDTLRAHAAALSSCYQFAWRDSMPTLPSPLPSNLELTQRVLRSLGYHWLGFFEVHPDQLQDGSYVIWRPLGHDSLEIELMATPIASPNDVTLSGVVVRDTLIGVVTKITYAHSSGQTLPTRRTAEVGHFTAFRKACR